MPPIPARLTFCTRSRECCLNHPGPGRNPERSRTRSDRLSNPAAADCSRFLGVLEGIFRLTTTVVACAPSHSSSLMRVSLRSSACSRLDDKIPAQKNERNFARLRTRMMYIQKMRVFTIQRDLSPFTFHLSAFNFRPFIFDLSAFKYEVSILDLSDMRFHFPSGGFNCGRFQLSPRGFNS